MRNAARLLSSAVFILALSLFCAAQQGKIENLGTLADSVGFGAVFVVAALFGLVALVVLGARVRDPRHAPGLRYAGVATQE